MSTPAFRQHAGNVIEPDERFKLMMAMTLDPRSKNHDGIIRCITDRSGEIGVRGNTDRSALYKIHGDTLERFMIGEPLRMEGAGALLQRLGGELWDFIGFEDPDIWIDDSTGTMHVYFTIALMSKDKARAHSLISLGHAEGKNLDTLVVTEPVITSSRTEYTNSAKEVSIAPENSRGVRLNLVESRDHLPNPRYRTENPESDPFIHYSTVRVATAKDMGKPWELGETVFHPAEHRIPWIAEHASPGPLLPRSFIDLGPNRLLGIMNGREATAHDAHGKRISYRMFSVGLFIYDYERGKIEWVSPEPLIHDSEAKTITFASQFVETNPGEGILYAHVDDSFVRAYTLYAEGIRPLLP